MNQIRIREAGDSALLLALDETIDVSINARAIAIASTMRALRIEGVRDVVSTYHTVAVHFDPLVVAVERVRAALTRSAEAPVSAVIGKTVVIPVQYGGALGPDLNDVASFGRMSADDVVSLHAGGEYRVFMLGFLPGFAYMGSVDDAIAMPRHPTPRMKVPMGSVGIAGRQTGVYPRDSPGGWRIIGRTGLRLFDTHRLPASLVSAGDTVRFVSDLYIEPHVSRASLPVSGTAKSGRAITVVRPGLFTTIQDSGRWGHQASGVPVSGPMDRVSHRIANALVGNESDAAALEVTLVGPEIRIEADTIVAVAGGDLGARLNDVSVPMAQPVKCRGGTVLRFGERHSGARAYVAFGGGIDVTPVLGSRATHALSGLGGIEGRAIVAGDHLPLGTANTPSTWRVISQPAARASAGARLRVLPGPQDDFFPAGALDILQRTRFTITPQSDRMGYRLGGDPIPYTQDREMISDATFAGSIQVTPSGAPILLMADHQTSGGYPQIATVITADLPAAAQLAPGDWIEFEVCTRPEAISALIAQEGSLLAIR